MTILLMVFLSYDDEGAVADFTNLEPIVNVSPIPTSRINSIHPSTLILGDPQSAVQTRSKVTKSSGAHIFVDAMRKNKKDERGVVVRNKAMLVAQGHMQEEGIYSDEVFAPVSKIEAIRIFLVFASYMGLIVYQMDVKSTFLYGKIDEEVYVSQPLGFIDPKYPKKVYKVVKALYGLHQAPKAWYATLSTFLLKNGYRRGTIDKTLFINKDKQIHISTILWESSPSFLDYKSNKDKYVAEILKKFDFVNVKTASTPIETQKPLVKDEEASDVDVHLYRSMIGSLMFLSHVKTSHLSAVKRILKLFLNRALNTTYLEKTDGNAEFHEIIDFLARSSIHNALTRILVGIKVTYQAKEIQHLKAQIKKLQKKSKPVITHHRAWMKSVSLKQRLARKKSLKKNWMQKESVSKQGRKSAKAEYSVYKDPLFDELDDDEIDNMDTKDAQDAGRTRNVVSKVSTDRSRDSTEKEKDSTDRPDEGTVDQTEGRSATPTTPTTTPTMFGDDETIAQVLLNMSQAKAFLREKEKGVELKDVEETERT
ncbi:putative ribonuclease H-like domain-containing protein [Tanacetum coccineum]